MREVVKGNNKYISRRAVSKPQARFTANKSILLEYLKTKHYERYNYS